MKKLIDWLYSKGDNCSDFQKELRLYMFLKHLPDIYNLSPKETDLLETVTQHEADISKTQENMLKVEEQKSKWGEKI